MDTFTLIRRHPLRAAVTAFCLIATTAIAILFLQEGWALAGNQISDNSLFATAKIVVRATGAWIGLLLSAILLLAVIRRGRIYLPRRAAIYFLVGSVPLILYLWHFTQEHSLKRYAVSGDETSLLFQAEIFSRGMLWNKPLPIEVAPHFKRHHVATLPDREFSKYPPGFPLLLAAAKLTTGIEWTNLLVSLAIFLLLYTVSVRFSGARITGILAALFFALTTSTAFHAASYFSHPSVLLLVLLIVLVLATANQGFSRPLLIVLGLLTGAILLFRPWDAVLTGAALVLFFFREALFIPALGKRSLKERLFSFAHTVVVFGMGAVPMAVLFLFYQKIYTGDFFTSPYQLYYYGVNLIPSERLNEIHANWRAYFDKGLFTLTPNWLKAQADWTNKYLIWLLLLLPVLRLGRLRRFEWLVLFLPLTFILGYAVHDSGGGDSFGSRYYYPALWCWFYGAAEVTRTCALYLGRIRHTRPLFWLPYAAFLAVLFWYWRDDFPGKETGIMRGVNKRFALYGHVEKRVPPFEKAIVLIQTPTAMDRLFFTRHKLDYSDHILYGRYFDKEHLVSDLKRYFPDRTIYVFDWKKETKKIEFIRLERDEDTPYEKRPNDTHR